MTPDFRLIAESGDFTEQIRDRLMELSVTDEADGADASADSLLVTLDDRGNKLERPRKGAVLEVWLGYREPRLVGFGRYTVDEVGFSGPPDTLTIRGRAGNLREKLKAPRTRSWPGVTLGTLVTTIAREHGLTPRCAASLADVALEHVDQTAESDLHLLTRLAERYGATAKPAGGALVFAPKGEGTSASGKALPAVELVRADLTTWDVTLPDRGLYKSVAARYRDLHGGTEHEVTVGTGEPVYVMRELHANAGTARSAARAKLKNLGRGEAELTLTLPGDVRLSADSRFTLSGVRPGVDGEWLAERVVHRYTPAGYQCTVTAKGTAA